MAGIGNFAVRSDPQTFKAALNRLGSDDAFRTAVERDPEALTRDYNLSIQQLHALRQAAILSGVNMTTIEATRIRAIDELNRAGNPLAVDVNVSCCCCCCCGETAVVRSHA